MKKWYYRKAEGQIGPISDDELLRMIRNGELARSTYVWASGMTSWQQINAFEDFTSSSQTPPPFKESNEKSKIAIKKSIHPNVAQAFKRFFAKVIDIHIAGIVALFFVILVKPATIQNTLLFFILAAVLVLGVFDIGLECQSPGRYIFGLRVKSKCLSADYGERFCKMLIEGGGGFLPIICLITSYFSFRRLKKHGSTAWDEGRFVVESSKMSIGRWVFASTITFVFLILSFLINLWIYILSYR